MAEFLEDERLAVLAASGDELAMEELLQRYKPLVRSKSHLYFMLGSDGEDLVQEGMIGLVKAVRSFDPQKGAAFKSYADLCINRQMINAIKAASRQKDSPLNTAMSLDRPVSEDQNAATIGETIAAGDNTDPLAIILLGELTAMLSDAENDFLSDLEHSVLKLMIEGFGYKDIAEKLGKSPKQIDNCIQRIRAKLRQFFSE